jgi:hypothetical protein
MFIQKKGDKRAILYPASSNKVILYIGGFPKYPSKNNVIEFANKKNYNVLHVLYSGSFDSGGKFSINQSIADINTWYKYIKKGELFVGLDKKPQVIKPKEIIILSNSYGSYVTDLALRCYTFNLIKKCIFLSPLFRPYQFKDNNSIKIAKKTQKILKRSYPYTYRFDNLTSFFKLINGENSHPISHKTVKTRTKKTVTITGKDDIITPQDMAKQLASEYPNSSLNIIKGGHSSHLNHKQLINLLDSYL